MNTLLVFLCLVISFSLVFAQNSTGTVSPGTTPACGTSYCGNGRCEPWFGESCANCAYDCGLCPSCDNICGNLRCETGETACNCPTDCGSCCVDGWCKFPWENPTNCRQDCVGNLAGYVISSANFSAIAGATVSCIVSYPTTSLTSFPNATTSAAGYFTFANTSVGNYTCYATAAGFFPGSVSVDFRAGIANFTVRIVLSPLLGSISGELRDARTGAYLRVVNVSCDTPFTAPGGITTSNLHKFASDTYFFDYLTAATYSCTASKAGWFPSTQTVTVTPANNTVANFYLQQRPTFASGYLLDIRTLNTISPGAIYCRSSPGNETFNFNVNANGFYNVSVTKGYTYLCEGSAPDYLNKTFVLDCPYFKNVTLTPLRCTVNVFTIDTATGLRLGNVSLDFRSPNITNINTDSNGYAQVQTKAFLYSYVVGSKAGYLPDSEIIYCNRSGVANITLYLTPIPNRLTVLVLDQRDGKPIITATVTLQGGNYTARQVNGTGYVEYFPINSGNYVAGATAPGYFPNSTVVPTLTYNSTVFVIIYLREAPCTVIITVYDTATNATLSDASVFLLPAGTQFTTDSAGTFPTQQLFADSISGYNASKVGYTSETGVIACARNRTVNIRVYLTPLPNTITVFVYDADTLAPLTAYLSLTAPLNSAVQANTEGRYTWNNVPAGTYTAFASLGGYADNNTYVGITTRNTSLTAIIYLRTRPCIVTITVLDATNNAYTPLSGALVTFDTTSVTGTTPASGNVTFTFSPNSTLTYVYGFKDGYNSDDDSFTCGRGVVIERILYLVAQPNNLTVLVRDAQTFQLIPGASVTLAPLGETRTVADGSTKFIGLAAGTYQATGSATGYSTNTSESATLTRNEDKTVTVWLRTRDCIVNVLVVDGTNNANTPLDNAIVGVDTTPNIFQNTTATGFITFNFGFNVTGRSIGAYKDGYDTDDDTFSCSRGAVINITLTLVSRPNSLQVLVRDAQTFVLIPGASVTVTPTGGVKTATDGTTLYAPLPAGTYTASASAAGYGTNSSAPVTLLRNENKTTTVYLSQLSCTIIVQVLNAQTGAQIIGANVTLNNAFYGLKTTNPTTTWVVFPNTPASTATGTAAGFRGNDTQSFVCTPGNTTTVTLRLSPVIQVFLSPLNSYQGLNTRITNAIIIMNGVTTITRQSSTPGQYIIEPESLNFTAQFYITAPGFTDATRTITWTANGQERQVSLAPQNFALYFLPYETFTNGSKIAVTSPLLNNNIRDFPGDLGASITQFYYEPNVQTVGGSAVQYINGSSSEASQAFSGNNRFDSRGNTLSQQTSFNSLLASFLTGGNIPGNVAINQTLFSALFSNVGPSSEGSFYLQLRNITGLDINFPSTIQNSVTIFVPNYPDTDIRNLLEPIPYRINTGFFDLKVVPYESDGTTLSVFRANNFIGVNFNTSGGFSYSAYAAGKLTGFRYALLEKALPFGTTVLNLPMTYQGEEFDETRSGFVNTNGQVVVGRNAVIPGVTNFFFPPASLYSSLFTFQNGQASRNPAARLFVLSEYRLFRLAGVKRREQMN